MTRQHFAKYQRDELIFAEGSEGDEFFIVVTGRVGLSKRVDGRQELLHQIGPGELFGEIAVISSTPRSASAYALEPDTSVIAVDKARFLHARDAGLHGRATRGWRLAAKNKIAVVQFVFVQRPSQDDPRRRRP